MDRFSCLIVFVIILGIFLNCAAAQTVHVVGDGMGWNVPPNTSAYTNWVSGKTFIVGDILVFNFTTNQHDVLRVPQPSYTACTQANPIDTIITAGPANITLDSAGDNYYICTVGRHCQLGQKLLIRVASSTPGSANPPATAPPPPPTPDTPSPAAAMSPPTGPPPPDSGSTSLAAGFLLSLLSAAIAMIF